MGRAEWLVAMLATWLAQPVIAAAAGSEAAEPPARALRWREVAAGVERATLATTGGGREILFLRFNLASYRAEVVVGEGWPPRLETAAELRRRRGAVAAVNGGFFDEHHLPLGLRIARGQQRVPLRRKVDWGVLLLEGNRARIVHSRELPVPVSASGAIQVGPRLVVGGRALKLKPQWARRTAVALDAAGDTLTLVVADVPVEANELAVRLAENGFDSALMLDGGPSTQLSFAQGDVKVDIAGGYPVPDLLLVVPVAARPAPTPRPNR